MFSLSDTVRDAIARAMETRLPRFADFSDEAYAVPVGDHDGLFLLVYPAPDGAARAAAAVIQNDRLQNEPRLAAMIATVHMDFSQSSHNDEGILLVLGPRSDRCATLESFAAAERERMIEEIHLHPALADVAVEDVWVNTTIPNRPTPFLIRIDRVHAT
ncbi:MAG: hypothetical protein V1723_00640 [Candidatus Uhrbacteria bacterium]